MLARFIVPLTVLGIIGYLALNPKASAALGEVATSASNLFSRVTKL